MGVIQHRPLFDTNEIEKHYTEKDGVPVHYVCTTALDRVDTLPIDIFYRETPHPEFGNRYFGIYQGHSGLMITNADRVEDLTFTCGKFGDELLYSQHRHDMVTVDFGFIDGGRAYSRVIGEPELFTARVKDGIMAVL